MLRRYKNGAGPKPYRTQPRQARFERMVIRSDNGCWLWRGGGDEYGVFAWDTRQHSRLTLPAHRAAWLLYRGPLPNGKLLDHLCMVKRCVNPDHLEPVTPSQNTQRWHDSRRRPLSLQLALDFSARDESLTLF